jgi:hypothetical protein
VEISFTPAEVRVAEAEAVAGAVAAEVVVADVGAEH